MSLRILIIDDSPAIRFILKDTLENRGHTVVGEADNLKEAVRSYTRHKPDLVTLDLSLLDGDGLSVLRELRKIDGKAKILVISGNSQKKVVELITEAGASGFLEKPIKPAEVIAAIERITA